MQHRTNIFIGCVIYMHAYYLVRTCLKWRKKYLDQTGIPTHDQLHWRRECNTVTITPQMGYHYLCNQCLSPLNLWGWTPLRRGVLVTILRDKVCQWLAAGRWFSTGTLVSSTNKTDRHDIAEILLKVALNIINQTINL